MERYEGRFSRLLELAAGSAVALLASVLAEFPCFRDGAAFEGRRVTFHKRAQILVSDIWCLFSGKLQSRGFQTVTGTTAGFGIKNPSAMLIRFLVWEFGWDENHDKKKKQKNIFFVKYYFAVLQCVGHTSFAYVAHFVSLRDVWIRTQRADQASRCATGTNFINASSYLATHLLTLATHLPFLNIY